MTCIYIFWDEDPRTVSQRLQRAVSGFCSRVGMDIPPQAALTTARTELGKPYFPALPHLHFSVSHSGEYWGCAISDQTVGFDLQEREKPKNETYEGMLRRHEKMAHRFFHPVEAGFVSQDCRHNFLTVWTAREAYVKHTGQGIDRFFSEHCVVPESPEEQRPISGNSEAVRWSAMGKSFWKASVGEDYLLCVCTETACDCIVIKERQS